MRSHFGAASHRVIAGCLVALVAALVAACGSSSSSSSTSSSAAASSTSAATSSTSAASAAAPASPSSGPTVKVPGHKRVYLVTCEPNVYCHAYNINLTQKLEAAGVSVTQLSDNFDAALQNQHMDQAIAQKPNAIAVFVSNADAIVPALARAKAAHIPTINLDARLFPNGEKYITFEVPANNAELGEFAAQNLVEGMQKQGYKSGKVIVISGTMGTLIVEDRLKAFDAYMAKYPQYKVVATEDGNWDQVQSSQLALQLLTKYRSQGGIQGAYGMADYQAAGIIQAAQQLAIPTTIGQPSATVVTGSNCTPVGFPLLEQGKLYGDATQSPIVESDDAATHIIAFLRGQKQPHTVTVPEARFTEADYKPYTAVCSQWPSK